MNDRPAIRHAFRRAYWLEGYISDFVGVNDNRRRVRRRFRFTPEPLSPVDRLIAAYLTSKARSLIRFGRSNVTPRADQNFPEDFYQ